MKKKTRKRPVKGTLIEWELVEITDPAEQAEIDRRFDAAIRMLDEPARPKKSKPRKKK